jgi:hypothetical protein
MSKRFRIPLTVVTVLSLLSGSIFAKHQASQRKAASVAASGKNAAFAATTAEILKETSQIRELPILHPVKSGAQSRDEIEAMVIRNFDKQSTPAESHATEQTLKKLGLVPADFQYREFLISLLTEQVAGYFDPKQQEFFLADWIDLEGQKPVMAHELTHALQDQHFNLRRFEKWPKGDSDAELAAHALIEGDATLAMKLYMARNPLVAFAFIRSFGSGAMASKQFEKAPRSLRESLIFPYEEGMEWATVVYKRDGWKGVSHAFADLPQSSEQILHPEKYFAHEAPVKIILPELRGQLGSQWKRIDSDVNGEWSYFLILDQFLNAEADSKRAAAGWGGDRYAVYESSASGEVLIAQDSVWDTENDAREFFEAYVKRTKLRYGKSDAKELAAKSEEKRQWTTSEGAVALEIRGKRLLILEGIPSGVDANELLRAMWQ